MGDWSGTVPTILAGTVPLGSDWDSILGELTAIQAGWTSYTPTWSSSGTLPVLNNGTLAAAYNRVGNWGQIAITLTVGSTSTFGTGTYRFTIPSGWSLSNDRVFGTSFCYDLSATTPYIGATVFATSTTLTMRLHNLATNGGVPAPTSPFTFATGDKIYIGFKGEIA